MSSSLQAVFQTRYSFFGQSGWRSDTSKAQELLFDPERLNKRLDLFLKMNLACLRDQSDPDFKLVVLTSSLLPQDHLKLLTEACHDVIGKKRAHVIARAPGSAGRWLQKFTQRRLNTHSHSAQIVLDDDDAVSVDFVESCKREGEFALSRFRDDQDCVYLSYATGMTARFEDDGITLMPRVVPFTNLGLALVAPTDTSKNPYMLAHKKVARRHAVRVNYDQRPYYIRAVHDSNDSRAMHDDVALSAEAIEKAMPYFPLLKDLTVKVPAEAEASPSSAA
ncbi:putative rhamnosyl transferase [Roseobacter sp. YSTF-M11]|uniref:Rhamnosyl transferase n=1 Tax=Roseobacter insulae TaxID=2859783 RepID=A0A9X1FVC6_9RHOB|nr:glycosyltransferase [Roseobacter insulae]MBW4707815.1 putative rhamnosyl transferase [Roseobacter insulae]